MSRQVFLERPPCITSEQVDGLEALIRKKFDLKTGFGEPHHQAKSLEATLKGFDLVEQGSRITEPAFISVMQKLNCCNDKHVVRALFDRYDTTDCGWLDVQQLCKGLFGLCNVPQANPACRNVLQDARERILQRGGQNGVRTLSRMLRRMDDNGNRKLDKIELREGLRYYGLDLTDEESDVLFHYFDTDKSGLVSVTEFLVGVRGKMSAPRLEVVRMAYTRLDKDNDRKVTLADLLQIYSVDGHPDILSGSKTPEEVIQVFAQDWDRDGNSIITESEFIEYYKDISAGIDDDAYFELMLRNAWRMGGGKDWAANTANRRVLVVHLDGTQTVETLIDDFGIGDDKERIKSQLRKQGVDDILRVSLN
eukprot:TRINITY_DN7480_c0_g1_i2.p1 TRINITY_DN7480_c0_g1~~TRINITY_DN7480_c0_g1_i2.p1  ORF type:complete len:365 (+),score=144.40 TRINITY_DN7480_c0_g1_i2:73-1167(+)